MFLCKINFPTEVTVPSFIIFFGINLILAVVMIIVLWYVLYRLYLLLPWNKQSPIFIILSFFISTFGLLIAVGCAVQFTDTFWHSFVIPNVNGAYGKLEKVYFFNPQYTTKTSSESSYSVNLAHIQFSMWALFV